MKQTLNQLFASIVACLATTAAYAGIFTYTISPMDGAQGVEGCRVATAEAAVKFAGATGVSVVSHGCEVDSALGRLTGKILYSAPEGVSAWSTTLTTYGEEVNFHRSREECEFGLQAEIDYLRQSSALEPFIAYCYKTSELSAPRFRTRIDAIGETTIRRYESVASLSNGFQDLGAVVTALDLQGRAQGLTPVAWYQGTIRSMPSLVVAYYAESSEAPWRILSKRSLYYSAWADCEASAALANQTNTSGWQGVVACSASPQSAGFQLNFIWWDRAIVADSVLETTPVPGAHASLADCQAAAVTVATQLGQAGEQIVSAVCGRDISPQSGIRMEIISLNQ